MLPEASCDALLVTSAVSIRYLIGFTGSAGRLLARGDEAVLVTDGRYGEQAAAELAAAGVDRRVQLEIAGHESDAVIGAAVPAGIRLGLEADTVSWAEQRRYGAAWTGRCELVPTEGLVGRLRERKEPGEIDRIAAAAAIADEALAEVAPLLGEEPTEQEFRDELEGAMRRLGAQGPSFETIVAAGPNSARPHARPTTRTVRSGDTVVLDFGALVEGYHSDMTRTVVVGEPTAHQRRVHRIVNEAQAAGVATVAPGVALCDVDHACRSSITAAGYGDQFVHGTGHGVGLAIHEGPWVAGWAEGELVEANVVTVEPGVYLAGDLGVRIEDTVVVDPDGARRLTASPKVLALDDLTRPARTTPPARTAPR